MAPSPAAAEAAMSSYPKLAEKPVGKKISSIYHSRLNQFVDGGQYKSQNLISKLVHAEACDSDAVSLSVYSPPDLTRPTFKEATSHDFKPTKVGESFGPSWATHWFRVKIKVPSELQKHDLIEFRWDASNEGMIWTKDGEIVHGLTGGGERTQWILPKDFCNGKEHTFYVEMACNGMFGNAPGGDSIQPPPPDKTYQLKTASLVAVNVQARALYYDYLIIHDAANEFPGNSWEAHQALDVCTRIIDAFGSGNDDEISACREIAKEYLGPDVDSEKVYQDDKSGIDRPDLVTGIGHCHIDSCWLWPWAETRRKVARSWSNQCDLMERYPELRFCCSQAQQFKWLEEDYPSLFERVKEKIKQGQFHPIGGSWVEHDTNMPSGESLVRQFVYGQRYFESRFGIRCKTFWLPDTFGYSAQLPQLCRLAGMSRFFTQKLSWNNINKFPHTTFNWVSPDGTQVLCHMTPSETYTAEANFGDLRRSISQHKTLDQDATSLLVFGKGDGGGGPTWNHLEKLRRCRGISEKVTTLPKLQMNRSVDDFFAALEDKIAAGTEFPTWHGELYFELHRGTYTTQAKNKANNRKSEALLREIETLAALASVDSALKRRRGDKTAGGYVYPKKDLDFMWEAVLLCQFHDCLPGSSIEMCYDDSDELYAKVFETGGRLVKDAVKALGLSTERQDGYVPVGLNVLPWARSKRSDEMSKSSSGLIDIVPEVESSTKASVSETSPGVFSLSNSQFDITIKNGVIVSLKDKKAMREIIPEGKKANQFVIYDDKPLYWQAWDVEVYHLETRRELGVEKTEIVERGPTAVSVRSTIKISDKSSLTTTVRLRELPQQSLSSTNRDGSGDGGDEMSSIEIECDVDWHETMKFLKVEFPVDIVSPEATYENQFGLIRRPTHYNTSWDMAKFEVCCHRWADLSETGYGVAILNDSKYGFATVGKVMRLSLVRAPKAPDANADQGKHRIRYAILPHQGPLDHRVVRAGIEFNNPVRQCFRPKEPVPATARAHALLSALRVTGCPAIVLDTIKRADDDDDDSELSDKNDSVNIVVRLYESLGGTMSGYLEWGATDDSDTDDDEEENESADGGIVRVGKPVLPVKKVFRTNLLEDRDPESQTEVQIDGGEDGSRVELKLRPFEVVTLRLEL